MPLAACLLPHAPRAVINMNCVYAATTTTTLICCRLRRLLQKYFCINAKFAKQKKNKTKSTQTVKKSTQNRQLTTRLPFGCADTTPTLPLPSPPLAPLAPTPRLSLSRTKIIIKFAVAANINRQFLCRRSENATTATHRHRQHTGTGNTQATTTTTSTMGTAAVFNVCHRRAPNGAQRPPKSGGAEQRAGRTKPTMMMVTTPLALGLALSRDNRPSPPPTSSPSPKSAKSEKETKTEWEREREKRNFCRRLCLGPGFVA